MILILLTSLQAKLLSLKAENFVPTKETTKVSSNKKEAQTLREESLKKLENKEKHLKSFVERFGAKASKAKQAQAG